MTDTNGAQKHRQQNRLQQKYCKENIGRHDDDTLLPKKYSSAIFRVGYFGITYRTHVNPDRHSETRNDKRTLRNGGRLVKSFKSRRRWQHRSRQQPLWLQIRQTATVRTSENKQQVVLECMPLCNRTNK